MTSRSVVFAEPVRTAIGTFGGSLKDVPAPTLGAVAISGAVARAGLRQDEVETVVMGNVVQAGEKMNPARQSGVRAGLPVTTPAMTVNQPLSRPRKKSSSAISMWRPPAAEVASYSPSVVSPSAADFAMPALAKTMSSLPLSCLILA
jgi:hypothetical protein